MASEFADLVRLPSLTDLTDAEWTARDAAVAAERAAEDARKDREHAESLRRDLAERGCPVKDLERAISGDLIETPALVAARAAHARGQTLVALSGPPGLGKTTAATWWLLQRREPTLVRTGPPWFVDAARLARWPKYDTAQMTALDRASALVIDDLGVEFDDQGGAFRSLLDGLVNARYAACLPTLLTTNLGGEDFKRRYHERLADRIREAGDFVPLRGASLRGAKP